MEGISERNLRLRNWDEYCACNNIGGGFNYGDYDIYALVAPLIWRRIRHNAGARTNTDDG